MQERATKFRKTELIARKAFKRPPYRKSAGTAASLHVYAQNRVDLRPRVEGLFNSLYLRAAHASKRREEAHALKTWTRCEKKKAAFSPDLQDDDYEC